MSVNGYESLINRLETAFKNYEKKPDANAAYSLMLASQKCAKEAEEIYIRHEQKPTIAKKKIAEAEDKYFHITLERLENGWLLTLPPLLNKKKGLTVSRTLGERVSMLAYREGVERMEGCTVKFTNKVHYGGSVQDYDNLDTRAILNILAETFLSDDNIYAYTLIQCAEIINTDERECCEVAIFY